MLLPSFDKFYSRRNQQAPEGLLQVENPIPLQVPGVPGFQRGRRPIRIRRNSFSLLVAQINRGIQQINQVVEVENPIPLQVHGVPGFQRGIRSIRRRRNSFSLLAAQINKGRHAVRIQRNLSSIFLVQINRRRRAIRKQRTSFSPLVVPHTSEKRALHKTLYVANRKKAREQQSDVQRASNRVLDSAHRKRTREQLTKEQQALERALNSASRKRARGQKTEEQQKIEQALNSASKRKKRGIKRRGLKSASQDGIVKCLTILSSAQLFRKSCADLSWVSCPSCYTCFPDISIQMGVYNLCFAEKKKCNSSTCMFSSTNLMDPGVVPIELSQLTNLEQILIARIHPMMSVYRVKGQQYKYSGNVINFAQDVDSIAKVLPYKPADLSAILIVNKTGMNSSKEFLVRREFVRRALSWLKHNHRYYHDITIDEGTLEELPEEGIPEGIPHSHADDVEEHTDKLATIPLQEDDYDGPPQLDNQDIHIDEFEASGTIYIAPQPDQQACIERALQSDADQTVVDMPFKPKPINEFSTEGYIAMVFPVLFPTGNADLRQARPRKVKHVEYFQYLMKYHDGRFAKDSRFRYFAWNSISRWRAVALGDVYVRKNPLDGDLSINDIKNMLNSGDKQLAKRVYYYAKNIRGTRAFWFTKLQELTALVKQLGAPTIFFTLSAADMQWPELFQLLDLSKDLQRLSSVEQMRRRAKLINENPHVVAWFFQKRVALFFRDFLQDEFSVKDYWYRFEWQNRGSGHVHGFLWLKDSPDVSHITTNPDDKIKILEYFDRLVCTVNPDPNVSNVVQEHPCARVLPIDADLDVDDDDYASLVNWVMRHSRCGSYCQRLHKKTKQMTCRFRYPFDVCEKSTIVEEPPDSKMYRFMGQRTDPLVCSHNRKVLQSWRANIDWSPVLSVQAVVNYIGKYAAKAEPASKSFMDTLREIVEDLRRPCQNVGSAIKRLLIRSVSERDVSAQEVCHLLMGYPLARCSRTIVLLNVSENTMMSSTVRQRQDNEDEDTRATDPSFVGRYLDRPSEFQHVSLFDMARKHYFKGRQWCTYQKEAIVRVVPDIGSDIAPDSENWEKFCRLHVLLHHHYRSLEEAQGGFESWSARYNDLGYGKHQDINFPEPLDDDFVEDVEEEFDMENLQREEWMMAAGMGPMYAPYENIELGMRDFDTSHNWAECLHRYPNINTERRFVHNCLRSGKESMIEVENRPLVVPLVELSTEQRVSHDQVFKSLQEGTSIRMIICGRAGTGKSTLINAIVRSAIEHFGTSKAVRIMAPTGVAAFNIGGATIHHELAISTERRPSQPYKNISGEICRRMQEDFKDTKLIIIDEYSMVGRTMLANVDLRCRDIFAKDELFGGVSVVLVGDMRQLPPVFDTPLYIDAGRSCMQQCGGIAYASFNKCVRLSHIFRQAGDEQAPFRYALQRLSEGTSSIDDWYLFRTRDYSAFTAEDIQCFKCALRLFPTKQAASDYNRDRLIGLGKPIARISSKNNCETASVADPDDAKGLEKVLCLSVGARVMLRANLETQNGLVNGAMGTVVDIVYAPECKSPLDMPLAVMVDFDQYRGICFREGTNIIPIAPQTSHWKSSSGNISCQRTQIPLLLCWAITIHKSQGLTLDRVVVDIGDKESLGLTFVALSRTRKLCDLAFSPMFTFERLQKIGKCAGLKGRLEEEKRLCLMSSMGS